MKMRNTQTMMVKDRQNVDIMKEADVEEYTRRLTVKVKNTQLYYEGEGYKQLYYEGEEYSGKTVKVRDNQV